MSSTLQAVTRAPNFTGFGKRPDRMPAHHADLPMGMVAAQAASPEASREFVTNEGTQSLAGGALSTSTARGRSLKVEEMRAVTATK